MLIYYWKMARYAPAAAVALLVAAALLCADPVTPPAPPSTDPAVDWLLSQATTVPATALATEPAATLPSVFDQPDVAGRQATLLLSNGQTISGQFSTTAGQPIHIYDLDKSQYREVPFETIKSMQARVVWERMQPQWRFKESGSTEKEFSGKSYPARETQYVVTLLDGQQITGLLVLALHLHTPQERRTFVLHIRDKADVGKTLDDLVFVQRVDFAP